MRIVSLKIAAAVAISTIALTGCSSTSQEQESAPPPSTAAPVQDVKAAVDSGAIVLDVRTPAEFAQSHAKSAVNLDFSDDGFSSLVKDLDPKQTYVVYCQSGNRSAQAVQQMRAAGLEKVIDAGGLEDIKSAGVNFS